MSNDIMVFITKEDIEKWLKIEKKIYDRYSKGQQSKVLKEAIHRAFVEGQKNSSG